MTDDLERRLRSGVREVGLHDDNNTELFDIDEASETMAEAADKIGRLRAENEALREALKPFAHAAFEAEGYPDCEAFTLVLRPDDEDGLREQDDEPESLITAGQLRHARQALQEGSRHE